MRNVTNANDYISRMVGFHKGYLSFRCLSGKTLVKKLIDGVENIQSGADVLPGGGTVNRK